MEFDGYEVKLSDYLGILRVSLPNHRKQKIGEEGRGGCTQASLQENELLGGLTGIT